jgi:hypothetical protein
MHARMAREWRRSFNARPWYDGFCYRADCRYGGCRWHPW